MVDHLFQHSVLLICTHEAYNMMILQEYSITYMPVSPQIILTKNTQGVK